jgi:hypothetical protein
MYYHTPTASSAIYVSIYHLLILRISAGQRIKIAFCAFSTMRQFNRSSLKDEEFAVESLADEEATLELAMSSIDGSSQDFGSLKSHPHDRRLKSERIAMYTLIAFVVAMFFGLIPLSWKRRSEPFLVGDEFVPLDQKDMIRCAGSNTTTTFDEWLQQDMRDISKLCDPTFLGSSQKADPTRTPIKVFIMMGEANMVGAGLIKGDVEGSLEFAVHQKNRFTHLKGQDRSGWEIPRNDVRYVSVHNDFEVLENDWLTINEERGYFGPEIQFGYIMGEIFDEPVLIIKAAQGHNSLGGELLPPGSEQYQVDGYIYAGYGESPRRWEAGSSRMENGWRAGMKYDQNVANVKTIVRNIDRYYPGASTYEIAG